MTLQRWKVEIASSPSRIVILILLVTFGTISSATSSVTTTMTMTEPTPPPQTQNDCHSSTTASISSANTAAAHEEPTPAQSAEEMVKNITRMDATKSVEEFENISTEISTLMDESESINTNLVNVYLYSKKIDSSRLTYFLIYKDHKDKDLGTKIMIPSSRINKVSDAKRMEHSNITVLVGWWKNTHMLPTPKKGIIPVSTSAFTISYFRKQSGTVSRHSFPVSYYTDLRQDFTIIRPQAHERLKGITRQCAWLNFETREWDTSGCVANFTGTGLHCDCNHTTTFVTLLLVDTTADIPEVIYLLTTVLQSISIFLLLLTIIFLAVARRGTGIDSNNPAIKVTGMNTNRTNSQISLCSSLMMMHLFSVLGGWLRSVSDNGCVTIAILTQYFLLASASWSLCEGLGIFVKMSSFLAMRVEYRTVTIVQLLLGWCVPLFITTITAAYGIQTDRLLDKSCHENGAFNHTCTRLQYPRYDNCWLSKQSGIIWAAVGPLVLVLATNVAILFYVTIKIVKIKKRHPAVDFGQSDRHQSPASHSVYSEGSMNAKIANNNGVTLPVPVSDDRTRSICQASIRSNSVAAHQRIHYIISTLRSFGILMPILGIPWIFGIFANIGGAGVGLSATHSVANGLQGFTLFLLYCVCSKRDWKVVKRKWRNSPLSRAISRRRHNRRYSVAVATRNGVTKQITASPTQHQNLGNELSTQDYDTLSSCRSSNGTMSSSHSLQRTTKTERHFFMCM